VMETVRLAVVDFVVRKVASEVEADLEAYDPSKMGATAMATKTDPSGMKRKPTV